MPGGSGFEFGHEPHSQSFDAPNFLQVMGLHLQSSDDYPKQEEPQLQLI